MREESQVNVLIVIRLPSIRRTFILRNRCLNRICVDWTEHMGRLIYASQSPTGFLGPIVRGRLLIQATEYGVRSTEELIDRPYG